MSKNIRLFLAIVILLISLSLLVWGYAPNARETRLQTINSTEMSLP